METSKTVAIVNDAVYESPDEWFELQLFGTASPGGATVGAQNKTRVTIADDGDAGTFTFSAGRRRRRGLCR